MITWAGAVLAFAHLTTNVNKAACITLGMSWTTVLHIYYTTDLCCRWQQHLILYGWDAFYLIEAPEKHYQTTCAISSRNYSYSIFWTNGTLSKWDCCGSGNIKIHKSPHPIEIGSDTWDFYVSWTFLLPSTPLHLSRDYCTSLILTFRRVWMIDINSTIDWILSGITGNKAVPEMLQYLICIVCILPRVILVIRAELLFRLITIFCPAVAA